MADFATIKPASEALVDILHPVTNEPTGMRVSIMSLKDDRMKSLRRQIQDRRLLLERKGKGFKSEDLEENGYEIAFRAMTGWDWGKDADGEPNLFNGKVPEFSKPVVLEVFKALEWFYEQVMQAADDDKRFFVS